MYKWTSDANMPQAETRYIVDISGGLPTILCEVNDVDSSLTKSYFYADAQILKQVQCTTPAKSYYYIHDRLGSIRQVVDANGTVVNSYTYNPFGEDISAADCIESIYNPFKFTGQWYDAEIGQYYLRARMYDPQLMRFTARDPAVGQYNEPLTLHKYLYCQNHSVNRVDPTGLYTGYDDAAFIAAGAISGVIGQLISDFVSGEWSSIGTLA